MNPASPGLIERLVRDPNAIWMREMRQSARLARTPWVLFALTLTLALLMCSIGGLAAAAATQVVGAANVDAACSPLLASEDFGAFLEVLPGNYMLIGSGLAGEAGGTPLHNPSYDFNDRLLTLGAKYFVALARTRLSV